MYLSQSRGAHKGLSIGPALPCSVVPSFTTDVDRERNSFGLLWMPMREKHICIHNAQTHTQARTQARTQALTNSHKLTHTHRQSKSKPLEVALDATLREIRALFVQAGSRSVLETLMTKHRWVAAWRDVQQYPPPPSSACQVVIGDRLFLSLSVH